MKDTLERQYWIDIAKSIGIYLIVFGHLPTSDFLFSFLWTFHVPLFFFISGFLNKPSSPGVFIKRLTIRLVIPYILVYLVTVFLVIAWRALHEGFYVVNVSTVSEMLSGIFWGTSSYKGFVNADLWFFPALIIVEIIFNLMILKSKWMYIPFLVTSICLYQIGNANLFLSIDLALLGLNYYIIGIYTRKYNVIKFFKEVSLQNLVLFVIVLLALTLFFAYLGNVWYTGNFYLTSLIAAIIGIAMVVSLSVLIERITKQQSFVVFISSNTLFIFCFHMFSNSFFLEVMKKTGIEGIVIGSLFFALLSILILIPFILLARRFFPQILGVRKKGITTIST